MSNLSVKEVVEQAYALFVEGKILELSENFTDDIIYHIKGEPDIPYAGVYKGKEAVLGFFQKLDASIEFKKFEVNAMVAEGNRVFVLVDAIARAKATNNVINSVMAHLVTVKNGKIDGFWDFADTLLMYKAMHEQVLAH